MSQLPRRRPALTSRRTPPVRLRLDPMECRLTPATATFTVPTEPVPEGSPVELTAPAGNDPAATYQWNVYAGTDTTATPIATGTDANLSFTPPDNGDYTVSLTVTDPDSTTATDMETITAFNVPPTASVTGSSVSVPGLPVTFTLGATDPSPVDQAADFTFNIDWGDGTTDQVTGPAGMTFTHTFATTGSDTVTVTATDKDGGVSQPVSTTLQVKTAALVDDFLNPGHKLLAVGGTDGADSFNLVPGGSNRIKVLMGGKSVGTFAGAGRIAVYGLGGNDTIHLAGSIRTPAWLDGGDGNDRLMGAKGNDVLMGGAGDDQLNGAQGADILIGGEGADRLLGGPGDDLMIGGTTSYDIDPTGLNSIAGMWTAGGSVADRINDIQASTTPLTSGDTSGTVLDDGAADVITGASGRGWVFADPTQDRITGNLAWLTINDATTPTGHGNGGGNGNGHGNGNGNGHGNH